MAMNYLQLVYDVAINAWIDAFAQAYQAHPILIVIMLAVLGILTFVHQAQDVLHGRTTVWSNLLIAVVAVAWGALFGLWLTTALFVLLSVTTYVWYRQLAKTVFLTDLLFFAIVLMYQAEIASVYRSQEFFFLDLDTAAVLAVLWLIVSFMSVGGSDVLYYSVSAILFGPLAALTFVLSTMLIMLIEARIYRRILTRKSKVNEQEAKRLAASLHTLPHHRLFLTADTPFYYKIGQPDEHGRYNLGKFRYPNIPGLGMSLLGFLTLMGAIISPVLWVYAAAWLAAFAYYRLVWLPRTGKAQLQHGEWSTWEG